MKRPLVVGILALAGCSAGPEGPGASGAASPDARAPVYGWTTLPAPPAAPPGATAGPVAATTLAPTELAAPATTPDAAGRIRLAWEIGPLRRLGVGIYRNTVELVVHVDPPVRIRVPGLQFCWDMVHDPSADPVPGAVAVLSCYNAGYGDYVVVARERRGARRGAGAVERYVVKAYGRGEGGEEAAAVERLRTVGRFEAPRGATFASDLTWPQGPGDPVRDDDS